jgi:hypothetical protein
LKRILRTKKALAGPVQRSLALPGHSVMCGGHPFVKEAFSDALAARLSDA